MQSDFLIIGSGMAGMSWLIGFQNTGKLQF